MATNMRTQGWSSVTVYEFDAKIVIESAFTMPATYDNHNGKSLPHYNIVLSNGAHVRTGPNNYAIHSYFYA